MGFVDERKKREYVLQSRAVKRDGPKELDATINNSTREWRGLRCLQRFRASCQAVFVRPEYETALQQRLDVLHNLHGPYIGRGGVDRSEEHTSELQSRV